MCAVRPRNATTAHVNRGMTSLAHTRKRGVGGGVQREREREWVDERTAHMQKCRKEKKCCRVVVAQEKEPTTTTTTTFYKLKKKEGMKWNNVDVAPYAGGDWNSVSPWQDHNWRCWCGALLLLSYSGCHKRRTIFSHPPTNPTPRSTCFSSSERMCVCICGRSNTLTAEDPTGTYYTQNAHKTSSPGR